jgi:hypothetical protein
LTAHSTHIFADKVRSDISLLLAPRKCEKVAEHLLPDIRVRLGVEARDPLLVRVTEAGEVRVGTGVGLALEHLLELDVSLGVEEREGFGSGGWGGGHVGRSGRELVSDKAWDAVWAHRR